MKSGTLIFWKLNFIPSRKWASSFSCRIRCAAKNAQAVPISH